MKVLTEAELNVVAGGRRKAKPTKQSVRRPDTSGNLALRSDDRATVS